jgi:hypothetical protein
VSQDIRKLEGAFTAPASYPDMLNMLTRGFKAAASMSQADRHEVVTDILRAFFDAGQTEDPKVVAERYKLTPSEAREMTIALSMMTVTLAEVSVSVEQFFEVGIAKGALDEQIATALRGDAERIIAERARVKEGVQRGSLANEVLPSVLGFNYAVDLRLKFEKEKLTASVPVLVAYLDTDGEGQRVWFQLTRADTERLIEQLQTGLESLKAASSLADKFGSGT